MKLSIAICVFALFLGACYADYTYDPIAPSDYSKHPLIQGLRDTGINFVLNQAYNKGDITTKNFVLTKTNSLGFRRAEGTSGNKFYQYNVSLVNENNKNETVVARFLVRYSCATEEQVVISWKYKSEIHSWVEIPLCPACNQPEPQPEPEEEECVEEAPVVEEEIVVEVPEEEEAAEEVIEEVVEEVAEEVIEEVAEEIIVEEEVEIVEEAEEAEDIEEAQQEEQLEQEEATVPTPEPEPVKNSTSSTETGTIVYPWILLPSEDYDQEFHLDNAAYGMNYLVNQEVARGNLTAGTWSVSVVNEIYEQTLPDVINYRYHLYADRAEDTWIYNFTFSVKIIKASGRRSIGFYRFQTLDANGNNISVGTLPDLAPTKDATQNYTTVIVDGVAVNTTTGAINTGK